VVLCAREKDEMEEQLEQWREALEKRGMRVSRPKTECICVSGAAKGSVEMEARHVPRVEEFKYLGSTLQTDGGVKGEVNQRVQCGWNNWRTMSNILCDKKISKRVKGKIHKMTIQPVMLYGLETVPLQTDTRRLDVAEMKMCT